MEANLLTFLFAFKTIIIKHVMIQCTSIVTVTEINYTYKG